MYGGANNGHMNQYGGGQSHGYSSGRGGGGHGQQSGGHPGQEQFGGASNQGGMPQGYGYGEPPNPMMMQSPLDAEIQVVLAEIHQEIAVLDQSEEWANVLKNGRRLLLTEADRLENNIDPEWLEVDINKPVKLIKKVLIPNFRHPNFNFVGKVIGPSGASLQNLAKTHKCRVFVLGRGSTKDRMRESQLLASGDPMYAHFAGPLHVKIETIAPAHVAYQRVAGVLAELNQILQPIRVDTTPGANQNQEGAQTAGGDESTEDSQTSVTPVGPKAPTTGAMSSGGGKPSGGGGFSRGGGYAGRGDRGGYSGRGGQKDYRGGGFRGGSNRHTPY